MYEQKKETMKREMELTPIPDYKQTFDSLVSQLTTAGFRIQTDRIDGVPEPTLYFENRRLGIIESDDDNNWEIIAETEFGYRMLQESSLVNCTIWAWYDDAMELAEKAILTLTKFEA